MPQPQGTPISREFLLSMRAMLAAMALIISSRFLLLLALVGAFVLGLLAMQQQSLMATIILGVYASLTVLPLVGLAWPTKPQGGQ